MNFQDFRERFLSAILCCGFRVTALLLMALFIYAPRPGFAGTSEAVSWLISQQQDSGAYSAQGDIAHELQSTSEVLSMLYLLGDVEQQGYQDALAFLENTSYKNTETIARIILAKINAGMDVTVESGQLIIHQNSDGGFGEFPGFQSTVLDTAFALKALASGVYGLSDNVILNAVSYLKNFQGSDGGWHDGPNDSSFYVSALAVQALWLTRHTCDVAEELSEGLDYFLNGQLISGGWGEDHLTALALLAVLPQLRDTSDVLTSIEVLENAQGIDSSWGGDVYVTALAVQALEIASNNVLNPDLGGVSGTIADWNSGELLPGAKVNLQGPVSTYSLTDENGEFFIPLLSEGEYEMSISLDTYGTLQAYVVVSQGEITDLGTLYLTSDENNSSTATIMGQVLDAITGEPLEGVAIEVFDNKTFTDAYGRYSLEVLPGSLTVTATLEGYQVAAATEELAAGSAVMFSPQLTPYVGSWGGVSALYGTVVDGTSYKKLQGVEVRVSGPATSSTLTDFTGSYRIEPLTPGTYTIEFVLEGYEVFTEEITVLDGRQYNFSPRLAPTGTVLSPNIVSVSGIILDSETNESVEGASIQVVSTIDVETVFSDVDGSFSVSAAAVSASFGFQIVADGYYPLFFEKGFSWSGGDVGQIRLKPSPVEVMSPLQMLPDLVIDNMDVEAVVTDLDDLLVHGELEAKISNDAVVDITNTFMVTAFYDQNRNNFFDDGLDPVLGESLWSEGIAAGAEVDLSITVSGQLPFRDAPIHLWVDSSQGVVERDDENNISSSASWCMQHNDPVTYQLQQKWRWYEGYGVMMSPIIAQTNDDNSDGNIDENDFADVIVIGIPGGSPYGRFHIISGKDGSTLFELSEYSSYSVSGLTAGDIDNDGLVEIVTTGHDGVVAMENDGTVKWIYENGPTTCYPSILDFDSDGVPEIQCGRVLLNPDGSLKATIRAADGLWGHTTHFDLDMDGEMELLAFGGVYSNSGELIFSIPNGYSAFANFDDDEFPEIVVISQGVLYLVDHNGDFIWGPVPLPNLYLNYIYAGPPVVADMDGDSEPEIGVATHTNYTLFDKHGALLWSMPIRDYSSGWTGASAFDFDGDGACEIVFNDEQYLRVFDGKTGKVLGMIANASGTQMEYPVVADIDNDNHAEIIVGSSYGEPSGLLVYEDANDSWAPARKIWNQYYYNIDNVNDDGTIPTRMEYSWLSHNSFRMQNGPTVDNTPLADLTVSFLRVVDNGIGNPFDLVVRVGNGGLAMVEEGVDVRFYDGDPATGGVLLGTVSMASIASGDYMDVRLEGVAELSGSDIHALVDENDLVMECREENNSMTIPYQVSSTVLGDLALSMDKNSYSANETALLFVEVINTGRFDSAFILHTEIEASDGVVVTDYDDDLGVIASSANVTISREWSTADLFAGEYLLHSTLLDMDGNVVDEQLFEFEIVSNQNMDETISCRFTTDRTLYHTTDEVILKTLVQNLTENLPITGVSLTIDVTDAETDNLFSQTISLGDLLPGAMVENWADFAYSELPVGIYTVSGMVLDQASQVLATTEVSFEILEDRTKTLTVNVEAAYKNLVAGDTQFCTTTIMNTGTLEIGDQSVQHLVVNLTDNLQVSAETDLLDLEPGATSVEAREVSTAGLEAGDYACVFQAEIDGIWETLGYDSFVVEVPPINIESVLEVGATGRILVLVDALDGNSGSGDGDNDCQCEEDGEQACQDGNSTSEGDFSGEPDLESQRAFLESLLRDEGLFFTVVTTADEFTSEFHSGTYSVYAIFSEKVKLSTAVQEELTEAVYNGAGLVVAGSHDQRNQHYIEALGVKIAGKHSHVDGVVVDAFDAFSGGEAEFTLSDYPLKASVIDATLLGRFVGQETGKPDNKCKNDDDDSCDSSGDDDLALALNLYGEGRAIYAGFDLLAEAAAVPENALYASLIVVAIKDVDPVEERFYTGSSLPMQLKLLNQGIATTGRTVIQLPENIPVLDPGDGFVSDDGSLVWIFDLAEEAYTTWGFLLRLPDDPGAWTIDGLIQTGIEPGWTDYGTVDFTVDVEEAVPCCE